MKGLKHTEIVVAVSVAIAIGISIVFWPFGQTTAANISATRPATTQINPRPNQPLVQIHGKVSLGGELGKGISITLLPNKVRETIAVNAQGEAAEFEKFADQMAKEARTMDDEAVKLRKSADGQKLAEQCEQRAAKYRLWLNEAREMAHVIRAPIKPDTDGLVRIQDVYERLKALPYFDSRVKDAILETTTSDETGTFSFKGVKSGDYVVFAEIKSPMYRDVWFLSVTLRGEAVNMEFTEKNADRIAKKEK